VKKRLQAEVRRRDNKGRILLGIMKESFFWVNNGEFILGQRRRVSFGSAKEIFFWVSEGEFLLGSAKEKFSFGDSKGRVLLGYLFWVTKLETRD